MFEIKETGNILTNSKYFLYSYQFNPMIEHYDTIVERLELFYPIIGYVVHGDILHTFYPKCEIEMGLEVNDVFTVSANSFAKCYPYFDKIINVSSIILNSNNVFLLPQSTSVFDGDVYDENDFKEIVLKNCERIFQRPMVDQDRKELDRILSEALKYGSV